ncbi:MAG: hypothetical protein ACREPQ_00490 [Rhodanobacter sp.]
MGSTTRQILTLLSMPVLVAGLQLLGTVLFQCFIYWWYGEPQFSDLNLSQDDLDRVAATPTWLHGPAYLFVRAWHLWAILGNEGIWVLVGVLCGGTLIGWLLVLWPARSRSIHANSAAPC